MTDNPSTPVVDKPTVIGLQDPSPLVTQMTQREVAQLQALIMAELTSIRRDTDTRFAAMDKALAKVEQYPTEVDRAIGQVREYFEEKFRSVELRFSERDSRFKQRDEDNTQLLREQRTASETAIAKAESSVGQQLVTLNIALRDMKERMDRTEGKAEGAVKLWGTIVAAIMAVGVIVTIMTAFAVRIPSP